MDRSEQLAAHLRKHVPLMDLLAGGVIVGAASKHEWPVVAVNQTHPTVYDGEETIIDDTPLLESDGSPANLLVDAWTRGKNARKRAVEIQKALVEAMNAPGPLSVTIESSRLLASDQHGRVRRVSIGVSARKEG